MRSIIEETNSGSAMRQQTVNGCRQSTRTSPPVLELREATSRMWRRLSGGIPKDIQNIVFNFTRSEPRNKQGHLLGSWPRVSESLAKAGAPYADVMSPVMEHAAKLKREVYNASLPPLAEIEQREADDECALHHAEILHDANAVKTAARDMAVVAELLAEAADREIHRSQV